MATTPTIPSIPTTQTPSTGLDINSVASMAGLNPLGAPPPQYIPVTTQAPVIHMPTAQTHTPRPDAVPYNNTSNEINRAKKSNNIREVTNAIGAFAQKKSQEKTDALKAQIGSVLVAQQRIQEAQQVLQNDPKNAAALQVLQSNKKTMEGILNGKDGKAIQKAFDFSYTDPSKNKTPEVEAMQAAVKEHQQNAQGGHDINNAQEHSVATAAGNPATVPLNVRPGVQMNSGSDLSNVVRPTFGTVPGKVANTPYTDQFLQKAGVQLAPNPQYAAYQEVLKQRTATATKILPDILKEHGELAKQGMVTDAGNQRFGAKLLEDFVKHQATLENNKVIQSMRGSQAFSRVVQQGKDAMARATLKAATVLGAANDPRVVGTPLEHGMKVQGLQNIDKDIAKEVTDLNQLQTQLQIATANKAPKENIDQIKALVEADQQQVNYMMKLRKQYTEQAFGKQQGNTSTPDVSKSGGGFLDSLKSGAKYFLMTDPGAKNGDGKSQSAAGIKSETVGTNLSDDENIDPEETDGDLDPDNFDQ